MARMGARTRRGFGRRGGVLDRLRLVDDEIVELGAASGDGAARP
jgi:hypothetical protein